MNSELNPYPDYRPGLHCLAEVETSSVSHLTDFESLRNLWNDLIAELGLTKVGETYHSFPGGGYTAYVCLTESHLSIHTWPEYNRLNLDIFLSNFKRDNNSKTELILQRTLDLFQPRLVKTHQLER